MDEEIGEVHREAVVLSLMELEHRGAQTSEALTGRAGLRRGRRSRKPRFDDRARPEGWPAPSLQHRVDTTLSWMNWLCRRAPVTGISLEQVRFDLQKTENPEIAGVEYQQGTLDGHEARGYLLEKFGHCCVCCGATEVLLDIDHVRAKVRGGSDHISNLATACRPCNEDKGAQSLQEFLKDDPRRLARILAQAKTPLKDAAVDALTGWNVPTLAIKAPGRGACCRMNVDASGFPPGCFSRQKRVRGFQTGDRARAVVPDGSKADEYVGRIAVRSAESFNIKTKEKLVQGIYAGCFKTTRRSDGYGYQMRRVLPPRPEGAGFGVRKSGE